LTKDMISITGCPEREAIAESFSSYECEVTPLQPQRWTCYWPLAAVCAAV